MTKPIESDSRSQPHSVGFGGYRFRMPRFDSRRSVAASVRALAPKKPDGSVNVTQLGQKLGRGGSTNIGAAQRLLSGQTSVGLDLVDQAAEALGVRPWDLLVPAAGEERGTSIPAMTDAERDLVLAFRDIPEESQRELLADVMQMAERSRKHVEKILRERFNVNGTAPSERVAAALPKAPPPTSLTEARAKNLKRRD